MALSIGKSAWVIMKNCADVRGSLPELQLDKAVEGSLALKFPYTIPVRHSIRQNIIVMQILHATSLFLAVWSIASAVVTVTVEEL